MNQKKSSPAELKALKKQQKRGGGTHKVVPPSAATREDSPVAASAPISAESAQQMAEHRTTVYLSIGGRNIPFELMTIEADKVEQETVPLEQAQDKDDGGNPRWQTNLNTESLRDILSTMGDGQTLPAIGCFSEEHQATNKKIITVIDGSRRRMSCIISKMPYIIYVCKETLTQDQCDQFSFIAGVQKQLSAIERGRQYKNKIGKGKQYKTKAALALGERVDPAEVRIAINANDVNFVPRYFTKCIPDLNDASIPNFKQFMREYRAYREDERIVNSSQKLQRYCESLYAIDTDRRPTFDPLIKYRKTASKHKNRNLTMAYFNLVLEFMANKTGVKKSTNVSTPFASNGKISASCKVTGGDAVYSIKNIEPEMVDIISQKIKAYVESLELSEPEKSNDVQA